MNGGRGTLSLTLLVVASMLGIVVAVLALAYLLDPIP